MGSTWDFVHRKVFENHPANQALRVPESDGKLRERSFFQVRTWETKGATYPLPRCSQEMDTWLLVTQSLWLVKPSWVLANLCEQSG